MDYVIFWYNVFLFEFSQDGWFHGQFWVLNAPGDSTRTPTWPSTEVAVRVSTSAAGLLQFRKKWPRPHRDLLSLRPEQVEKAKESFECLLGLGPHCVELNRARDVLCDRDQRRAYDLEVALGRFLGMPGRRCILPALGPDFVEGSWFCKPLGFAWQSPVAYLLAHGSCSLSYNLCDCRSSRPTWKCGSFGVPQPMTAGVTHLNSPPNSNEQKHVCSI